MGRSQKIVTNIWSNGSAVQQAQFYAELFRDASWRVTAHDPNGQPLLVDVKVVDLSFTISNGDARFTPNPSISLMLNFDPLLYPDAADYLDQVYAELVAGGGILMELGEYRFSARYAWVVDRFGMSWQLILTRPEGDPRPFLIPALLFGGDAQGRCHEAVSHYIDTFPDSGWGNLVRYPADGSAPSHPAGQVMFCDFQLAGQWFTAMDSGVPQPFTFTEGVSLVAQVDDQTELDDVWAALSAVPEAERCGWCKDGYGLSWQVLPANLGELLADPGTPERLFPMRKLIIDELRA